MCERPYLIQNFRICNPFIRPPPILLHLSVAVIPNKKTYLQIVVESWVGKLSIAMLYKWWKITWLLRPNNERTIYSNYRTAWD